MRTPRPLVVLAAALFGLALSLAGCGGGGGGSITVSGTVLDDSGLPLSGAHVVLNGGTTSLVTTGVDGKFTFASVATPYALTAQSATDLVELHGLTRANPVVAFGGGVALKSARLSGALSGLTFPLPLGQGILVAATNGVLANSGGGTAAAYGPTSFIWQGASPIATDVVAMQVTAASGLITAYGQYGKRTGVQLQDGVDMTGLDIALTSPMTTTTTTVSINPGAYTSSGTTSYLKLKGGGASFLLLGGGLSLTSGASILLPDGGGTLMSRGEDASGNAAGLVRTAVLGGTTTFALPASVVLRSSLPADGASGVSKTPIVSWTPVSGASLYQVQVSGGGKSYAFFLPGNASTLSVPDYGALGVALAGATTYDWSVLAITGGGLNPDAIADPSGGGGLTEITVLTASELSFFQSASSSFTTAP